jgi:hypothetical protein
MIEKIKNIVLTILVVLFIITNLQRFFYLLFSFKENIWLYDISSIYFVLTILFFIFTKNKNDVIGDTNNCEKCNKK